MAITPTIETSVNTVNGTSISVVNPAWNGTSSTSGVFITVWAMASNTTTFSISGGTFTAVTTSSGQNSQVQLFYLTTTGSESATFGITAGTSRLLGLIAIGWAGVTGSPFDPSAPSTSGQCISPANTNIPATGITTTNSGDTLVWFGLTRSAAPPNQTISLPSGFSFPSGFTQVNSPSTGATIGFLVSMMTQTTAGATGTITGTQGVAEDGGALLFALTPSGGTTFNESISASVLGGSGVQLGIQQNNSAAVNVGASVTSSISKILALAVVVTTQTVRQVRRALTAVLAAASSMAAMKAILVLLAATVTLTVSVQRSVKRSIAGAASATTVAIRSVGRKFALQVDAAGAVKRVAGKVITGTAVTGAAIAHSFAKIIAGTIAVAAVTGRAITRTAFTVTITAGSAVKRTIGKLLRIGSGWRQVF